MSIWRYMAAGMGPIAAAVSGMAGGCSGVEGKQDAAEGTEPGDAAPDVANDSHASEDAARPPCPAWKKNGPDGGLCTLPAPTVSDAGGPPYACWDQPGAPGPEACTRTAADAYGRPCCLAGSCGHDYGSGCTAGPLQLGGQTANAPSACGSPSNGVGRVYSGGMAAAMNSRFVFAIEASGSGRFGLVAIDKSSCAATALFEFAGWPGSLSATEEAVYWRSPDGKSLLKALPIGPAAPAVVDLPALFPGEDIEVVVHGADGENLYVIVDHRPRGCQIDSGARALVQVPCCDAGPMIVRDGVGSLSGDTLVRDGTKLFMFGIRRVLDKGNYATLDSLDLTSGNATAVIDFNRADATFGGIHSGFAYLALWRQILAFDPGTCATTVIADGRLSSSVPAMTTDDRGVYWAEAYSDLSVSRIFAQAHGDTQVIQVVETSRPVAWLGIDGTHLYWAEASTSGPQPGEYWLSRTERRF